MKFIERSGYGLLLFSVVILAFLACSKSKDSGLPRLATIAVADTSSNSAKSGVYIYDVGSSSLTAKGIVWSTSRNPTIALGTKSNEGTSGAGAAYTVMTGLTANTTYYVRAYATNDKGTAYGVELDFRTKP